MVRSEALRRWAFSFEKAFSIGLKSGQKAREEAQGSDGGFDGLADVGCLVARQVVHDDDVAWLKLGGENLLHVGDEGLAVDGAVDDHGCHLAGVALTRDERCGLPVPMGNAGAQTLAPGRPSVPPRHAGGRSGLVDEHQAVGIKVELALEPGPVPAQDVGPVFLGRVEGLFFARNLVTVEEAPDGRHAHRRAASRQRLADLVERQVGLFLHQRQQEDPVRIDRRGAHIATRTPRPQIAPRQPLLAPANGT